jgi:hypothetical protein
LPAKNDRSVWRVRWTSAQCYDFGNIISEKIGGKNVTMP